jgi:hypothetical protein
MDITTVLFIISSGLVEFCFVLFFWAAHGSNWGPAPDMQLLFYLSQSFSPFFVMGIFKIESHEKFAGLLTSILPTLGLK